MSSSMLDSTPVSSRVSSVAPSTLSIPPFGFQKKTSYTAQEDLTKSRSDNFRVRAPPVDDDIWKRPPPDFRPQCYEPKPAKRNSREAMQPWRYKTRTEKLAELQEEQTAEVERKPTSSTPALPQLFQNKDGDEPRFETRFHILDPVEARMTVLREGYFNEKEQYKLPHPHNFRPLPNIQSLGLPEFQTVFEKDPFNIKFNSKRIRRIHGLFTTAPTERDVKGRQMAPPLHQPPKWEARLIHPKDKWPNIYMAYTRYRLPWRSPEMVLMDRMEDTLTSQWSSEDQVKAGVKGQKKKHLSKSRDNKDPISEVQIQRESQDAEQDSEAEMT